MVSKTLQELVLLGRITYWLCIISVVLAFISVGLRLWVRYRITKSPGWDDAAMVATLLLFTTYCAFILVITIRAKQGLFFAPQYLHQSLMFIQLSEVFYILTTTTLKLSLGLFFLRVLSQPWQIHLFRGILAVSATYGLFYVFVAIFQCGDPSHIADSLEGSAKCLPGSFLLATGYIYGTINVVADWTFVLIPITVLAGSDLDRRSKVSVSLVMAFGAIGSVSSIFRMVYMKGLMLGGGLTTTGVKATIWATAEPGTGIIAASVAILRPLIRKIRSDVRSRISEHGSRMGSRHGSRKLPNDDTLFYTESDTIILTSQSAGSGKKESIYSSKSEDPWSPTSVMGRPSSNHMYKGKEISAPMPLRV